jgi:hypothetical protein
MGQFLNKEEKDRVIMFERYDTFPIFIVSKKKLDKLIPVQGSFHFVDQLK